MVAKVKEITFPEDNSSYNGTPGPQEVGTKGRRDKVRNNDKGRLDAYIGQGYTPNKDGFLYSPSGQKSNVRIDGSIEGGNDLFADDGVQKQTPQPTTATAGPSAGKPTAGPTPITTPIQQQSNVDQFKVDNTRNLAPMTDPIAYRESYDKGDIKPEARANGENKGQGGQQVEQQPTPQSQGSSNNFEDRLEAPEGGNIYGRGVGKDGKSKTLADPYSLEESELRERENRFNSLRAMDSYDIALALASGYSLYGETAMRDLMSYDPVKYQEVQKWQKWIQTGDTVNAIASGEHGSATTQIDKSTNTVNNSINSWTNMNSNERTHDQVQALLTGRLSNNQTATTATQEMLNLKSQIAELEEKMANLPKEAKASFKGDVPQYVVDAFVSNNAQRYQSEINKLQSRYQSALDLYKTELSNAQWMTEMDLKQKEYNFKVNQQNWENAYKTSQTAWEQAFKTRQQDRTEQYQANALLMNNIKTDKNGNPYIINPDGTYEYLSDATYSNAIKGQIQSAIDSLNASWKDGTDGGQCEEFTDSFNRTTFGKEMSPIDENGNPITGRSRTYGSEKVQYVTDAIPEVGMTAIFKYPVTAHVSNDAKLYGHTMTVTGYDPTTGMITLRGSNKTGEGLTYTDTMSLDDFYSKRYGAGFWAPWHQTRFEKEQQGEVVSSTGFQRAMTPMTNTINELKKNASTAGQLDIIATSEMMYNIMNELNTEGGDVTYTQALIESEAMEDFLNGLDRKKFGTKDDDRGSAFLEQLGKYMRNTVMDEKVKYAFNRLYQLVEQKLRQESGAAISSSEWAMDFQLFLPEAGQSEEFRKKKLEAWDDIIYKDFASAGLTPDLYVPLFNSQQQIQNGIRAG